VINNCARAKEKKEIPAPDSIPDQEKGEGNHFPASHEGKGKKGGEMDLSSRDKRETFSIHLRGSHYTLS